MKSHKCRLNLHQCDGKELLTYSYQKNGDRYHLLPHFCFTRRDKLLQLSWINAAVPGLNLELHGEKSI